jgi:hypothetical protein
MELISGKPIRAAPAACIKFQVRVEPIRDRLEEVSAPWHRSSSVPGEVQGSFVILMADR